MSKTIHMNTENVLTCAKTLASQCANMDDSLTSAFDRIRSIPWDGSASEQFKMEANSLYSRFTAVINEGVTLSVRVEREVDEWVRADQMSARSYASIGTVITGIAGGIAGFFKSIADYFNSEWQKLKTVQEKEAFLQKEVDRIAKELGFPPVKVKIKELNDPAGMDSRGYFQPLTKKIVIDKSDVFSSDHSEEDILETLAHETRHAYQHYCVDNYAKTGTVPDGVSEETVIEWRDNFRNYVDSDDDFEGYRKQPVETDARAYGDEYINRPS